MKWIWHLCIANMKRRGVRTFLTILGVVIGIISIVSMISLGLGVKEELLSDMESRNSIRQIIIRGQDYGKRKDKMITERTIKEISQMEEIENVYPRLELWVAPTYGNYMSYSDLTAVPETYLQQMELLDGEKILKNTAKPQLILGKAALENFYHIQSGAVYTESSQAKETITGEKIKLQISYPEGDVIQLPVVATNNMEYDYGIYTEIESMKKWLKNNKENGLISGQPVNEKGENYNEWIYSSAIVEVRELEQVESVVKKLNDMGFQTENDKEMVDSMNRIIKIIQIFLGAIGMIALLVAGIGISNTMTTAVYDRIHEIGILKVLGCEMEELLYLFLLEAGILGGVGGMIGIVVSYGMNAFFVNHLAVKIIDLPKGTTLSILPWWLMVLAIMFAVILGVIAGYFPAKWAAKMTPIDAVQKR